MEIAERIGKTAFSFNLIFSIVITIIGTALLANGIYPGDQVAKMFLPMNWIYNSTVQVQNTLPHNFTSINILSSLGALGVIAIFLEFMFMELFGFLVLVYTISTIIPSNLRFLIIPLYFIGAFIQLMVWVYALNMLLDKLTSLIPFRSSS